MAHRRQEAAPGKLKVPGAHTAAVALVEPVEQAYPAVQGPLHAGDVKAVVAPYRPAGQAEQTLAPAREYVPGPHLTAVPLVEPAGHACPALQEPEHVDTVSPTVAP